MSYINKYFEIYQNYIENYIQLLYNTYNLNYKAVPIIYYNYSFDGSIIDWDELQSGSYDLFSDNSGVRWNRIFMLPFFTTEPGNMNNDSNEKGIYHSVEISGIIPNEYSINATEYDHVYFIDDINDILDKSNPLFRVINVDYTSLKKNINFEHINLKTYSNDRDKIDNYIYNDYIFLNSFNKIYDYTLGKKLENSKNMLIEQLNLMETNYFNKNFQCFIVRER